MLAIVTCLLGCGESDVVVPMARRCVEEHPATRGELTDVPSLGGALQDCLADEESACDVDALIAPSAAVCIARNSGLSEGLTGLDVNLSYSVEFDRLTWSVDNTLFTSVADGEGGGILMVDAITGAILGTGAWQSTP